MPPFTSDPTPGDGASPDWQQVEVLRVADVVMTILKARRAMPTATAATVSRTRHGAGYKVLISLLEGSPSGDAAYLAGSADGATAVFVAGELGKDLADAFGDKDVFILQ
jgi:hypothetical protein